MTPSAKHSAPSSPHVLAVAWPLLAKLVLGFGVGFVGMWLVSEESDTASAAFGLANHVQGAFFLLFRIISMGVGVVITQNLGAGSRRDADRTALASLGASTWLWLGSALVLFAVTGPLLTAMQASTDVRALASPYLHVLAFALFLDAFNASMAAVMRSPGQHQAAPLPMAVTKASPSCCLMIHQHRMTTARS
jgi:Na+-driven multidrug efflux pump